MICGLDTFTYTRQTVLAVRCGLFSVGRNGGLAKRANQSSN